MVSLFGALIGFISSIFPEIFRFLERKNTQNYKINVLDLLQNHQEKTQLRQQEMLEFLHESAERKALYKHAGLSGIRWVDGLACSVRPILTYAFFTLYAALKAAQFAFLLDAAVGETWATALMHIWHEDDQVLFAAVMSFWFGQRTISKMRKRP